MRILFISATRIGDAVLSTGLLDYLLNRYPDAAITVACGPDAAGIFARMPRRDRTLIVHKRRFDAHWMSLWSQVAMTRWDLAVDLRGSALTLLLRARKRAIMRGGRRAGHRLTHLSGTLALSWRPLPVAWTDASDRAVAAGYLAPGGIFIGLGPTANWDRKIWPPERFVAVFGALRAGPLPGAKAVVFAGPGANERALAAPVLAALPDAIDLVGKLSLPQASACLAQMALFIGNDSGLMHMAAAAGAPTLGLFGPTPASEYAPAGRRTACVLAEGAPGASPMTRLPVDAVLQAALRLIEPR